MLEEFVAVDTNLQTVPSFTHLLSVNSLCSSHLVVSFSNSHKLFSTHLVPSTTQSYPLTVSFCYI